MTGNAFDCLKDKEAGTALCKSDPVTCSLILDAYYLFCSLLNLLLNSLSVTSLNSSSRQTFTAGVNGAEHFHAISWSAMFTQNSVQISPTSDSHKVALWDR